MTNSDERLRILKMVEDGKLNADDAAKLLAALGEGRAGGKAAGAARWLRIRVTDTRSGRSKASVQIPIALVESGMKIGAHFAPEVQGVDLSKVLDAVHSGVLGKIIDVVDEQDGEHVEIYVE